MTESRPIHAAPIIAGPPTYRSISNVDEMRGGVFRPEHRAVHSQGWNGQGSQGAVSAARVFDTGPTFARGAASSNMLKSHSRVGGQLSVPPPMFPYATATNRSETTRFFEYKSSTLTHVPVTFSSFLDGTLTSTALGEIFQSVGAGVEFGLQVVDVNNNVLANVLSVSARSAYDPLSPDGWSLFTRSSGAAALTDWNDAFTDITPPTLFFGDVYDVNYLKNFPDAYLAPVDTILGFRWYLETEAGMEGIFLFNAILESNFHNTAVFDQFISDSAAGQATVTEYFTVPQQVTPVPEPSSAMLLVGCLVMLIPASVMLSRLHSGQSSRA